MKSVQQLFTLSGDVVMITGASSGLGKHFANTLAAAGATSLVLAARRTQKLQETADSIRQRFPNCITHCVALDVNDTLKIPLVFTEIENLIGKPVNVLINNAGIAEPRSVLDVSESDWDAVVSTNLKGAFFVAQEAAKRMVKAEVPGRIVNIASILALRPGSKQVNYGAGLLQATRIMAAELLRNNIRVNALCPGYFETEMNTDFFKSESGRAYLKRIPPGRLGQLHELDGPLLLLASNASSFMTGTYLVVDLGHSNARL